MRITLFLVVVVFLFSGCMQSVSYIEEKPTTSTVCFANGTCVQVELAKTPAERQQGLMFREYLSEYEGMLFVFESEGNHGFWMKNTRIPLDAIWIGHENKIVGIQTMVPCEKDPCPIYTPKKNSVYVLEINAGLAEKWGLREGQSVVLTNV